MIIPRWGRVVLLIAILKVAIGVLGVVFGEWLVSGLRPGRSAIYFVHIVAFAAMAAVLIFGGREDRRAFLLAVCFLLVAATFADPLFRRLTDVVPSGVPDPAILGYVQAHAFLPYFFWLFVADFPRVRLFGRSGGFLALAISGSFWSGVVFFSAHLVLGATLILDLQAPVWLAPVGRYYEGSSFYHPILFLLMLPALPFLVWKARRAPIEEQRRVRLILAALVLGSAPALVFTVLIALPVGEVILRSPAWVVVQGLVYTGLLSIPFTTAYAVHVHQALDVKLVIRKAVQYGLARYTVLVGAATPFVAFVVLLFVNRQQSLVQLLTGTSGVFLMGAGVIGLVTVRLRGRMVSSIDRRFFREQYDGNRILVELVEGSRSVNDAKDLEQLLTQEVDRALHLDSLSFLSRLSGSDLLVAPSRGIRPLSVRSELAALLLERPEPIDIDLDRPGSKVEALPLDERQWLADGGFRLLVPLLATSGELIGLLALGEKRSELPYTGEDRMLLSTIASAASNPLEDRILGISEQFDETLSEKAAAECQECGALSPFDLGECPNCDGQTVESSVPLVLGGKFRMAERIGAGAMGVVYRAEDLNLGRQVAIKTLPQIAPSLVMRLRREARAMASVSHSNLATIFGAESWRGMPMLVFEFLSGGTLATHLEAGPMAVEKALDLGATLADVADHIHAAGILHRDIKPSNVGFTRDGTVKLLDFGLARAIEASKASTALDIPGPWMIEEARKSLLEEGVTGQTITGAIVGTVPYLSPEAVNGDVPDPSFDLWSICVVVYESMTGTNPFRGKTLAQTIFKICRAEIPDVHQTVPECSPEISKFFRDALSIDRRRRPPNGRTLARRLRELEETLTALPASA